MIITMMIIYSSNCNISYCYVSPSQEYDQHSNCPYIYHQPLPLAGKFRLVFPTSPFTAVLDHFWISEISPVPRNPNHNFDTSQEQKPMVFYMQLYGRSVII